MCSASRTALPTRIVVVGHTNSETKPLRTAGNFGDYVVLSHCWDDKRYGITTSVNIDGREKHTEVEAL